MPNLFDLPPFEGKPDFRVMGVPFDATTSFRGGTAAGPQSIIEASHQVDLFDQDFGEFSPKIETLPIPTDLDNEVARQLAKEVRNQNSEAKSINALSARLNQKTYRFAKEAIENEIIPVLIGGDHSIPYGQIKAIGERHPNFGILHLDAHADLREAYEGFEHSHASIFYNVVKDVKSLGKLVQVGIRDFCSEEKSLIDSDRRILTFFDRDLRGARLSGSTDNLINDIIQNLPEKVYLSFDIDGLDPTLCPGTGTPVPGGVNWDELCALLEALGKSGKRIIGMDLCEVTPTPAHTGQLPGETWDAIVGARVLFKMIGWAAWQKSTS